jgi:hypothetical protein
MYAIICAIPGPILIKPNIHPQALPPAALCDELAARLVVITASCLVRMGIEDAGRALVAQPPVMIGRDDYDGGPEGIGRAKMMTHLTPPGAQGKSHLHMSKGVPLTGIGQELGGQEILAHIRDSAMSTILLVPNARF